MEVRPVRMSGLAVGSSHGSSVQVTRGRGDSIASAAKKESWGGCVSRYVFFLPNLLWSMVKGSIRLLTCGICCSDQPTSKEMKQSLHDLLTVWRDGNASDEEKVRALDDMPPAVHAELVNQYVAIKRAAQLGKKATAEHVARWNQEHAAQVRAVAEERLGQKDISLVQSYLDAAADDNA